MTLSTELYDISFAGNPMIVVIKTGSSDFPDLSTFRQCVVTVQIGGTRYQYHAECDNSDTLRFDVSSAFSAELQRTAISPSSRGELPGSGMVKGSIFAQLQYFIDGQLTDHPTAYGYFGWGESEEFYAIRGGLSESARLLHHHSPYEAVMAYSSFMSTKPSENEVMNLGDLYLVSEIHDHSIQTTETVLSSEGAFNIGDRSIWVEDNPLRREFLFENSLGVIEGVSCMVCESLSYSSESSEYSLVTSPSFVPVSSIQSEKSSSRAVWKMSSGHVSRSWALWWVNDFLQSPRHWLRLSDHSYLPVSITPDKDDISIYDRSKQSIISIDFTVTSGIEGIIPF